jgi:3D (Asp-Asp-Asp) domain-containing protein
MPTVLRLTLFACIASVLTSCNTTAPAPAKSTAAVHGKVQRVRTTAYTHNEGGSGPRNAIGKRLSAKGVRSAASDWSRFPLGTQFRIVGTTDEYIIDDYGGALVGTNTIDLYKPSRAEMRRWGVRHIDIEIVRWGSNEESLQVLKPRSRHRIVRRMIAGLQKKT